MSPQVKKTAKIILLPIEGDSGHLYGMDNKTGSLIPFTFHRGTMASLFDVSKKMEIISSDMPRIDYGYYTNEPKILIEKESTNLVKSNATLDQVTSVAYSDDYYQGYKIVANSTLNTHRVSYNNGVSAADTQVGSVFLKYSGIRYVQLRIRSGSVLQWLMVDLIDGVISQNMGGLTASISQKQNGWYRVVFRDAGLADATSYLIIGLSDQPTVSTQLYQFTGNGIDGICYAYPQVEKQANPTSYIPISSSAVTRSADLLSIELLTDSNIEIQTTSRLIQETKEAGTWNIDQDLNNEGVKYIAIY
ncbi:hypothetical protein DCPSUM001_33220 [Dysgonomonas capnocytophagoides]|nr:hypothetical protein DCPSUM001_33220 [Dysgonomonas capnocytophagoides]